MPNTVSVTVEGLDELENALLELLPKKARAAMRGSLGASGDFMVAAMSAKIRSAPFKRPTGFAAEHIVKKVSTSVRDDEGNVSVGPSREAYYLQFDEFGSIHNRPAVPTIRPTFEENKEPWLDNFADNMRERLGL